MFDREKVLSIESNDKESLLCLPKDALGYMGSFLDIKSIGRISRLCRGSRALFKTSLTTLKAECLLNSVMYGNPTDVVRLLSLPSSDSECIVLKKVGGKEECERVWKAVSPLEFAAWASDTELINILLKTVPKAEKTKAVEQLQGVKQKGTEHGKYLAPYCSLIEAYDEYIAKFHEWSWDECDDYWIHKIGNEQFMLPLVGLQQMCDKEPFDPVPLFKRAPERGFKLYNDSSLVPLSSSGLASRFALFKGADRGCGGIDRVGRPVFGWAVAGDVAAVRRLCEERTKELASIIEQLQKPSVEMESHENTNRCVIS